MTAIGLSRLCAGRVHYAWIVLAVMFSATLAGVGVRAAPGVMILPLQRAFGWDVSTISGAVSVNIILLGVTGPFLTGLVEVFGLKCQTACNRDPGSAWNRNPSQTSGQACPGSEQEGPARVAQCPHERRSGARGRCLFAHRGKPGWHSGAVFEAPALVAGFDDFTMMG